MELLEVKHLDDLMSQHFFMLRTDFYNPAHNISSWLEEYDGLEDALTENISPSDLMKAIENKAIYIVKTDKWKGYTE